MEILRGFLIVLEALISFLLIGIILLQKSKGEGLGLAFGAGVGEQLFGSRAGNILTKGTVTLAILFVVNTAILTVLFTGKQEAKSVMGDVSAPVSLEAPPVPTAPADELATPTAPAGAPQPAATESAAPAPAPVAAPEPVPATVPAPAT